MSFNFTASSLVQKIVGISTTDNWVARLNEDILPAGLAEVINSVAKKIYLSTEQRHHLQLSAVALQTLFNQWGNQPLDENQLVEVLQGERLAGERLVSDITIQTCDQRQALLTILNNFALWFSRLSSSQKEMVTALQQRQFRLAMG